MQKLTESQNHRCCYCGHRMIKHPYVPGKTMRRDLLTKDHIEPRAYGGPTEIDNLIAACLQCNNLRGEMEANAFYNLQQKWFKRDPTLRARWHTISKDELKDFKSQCLDVQERQLRGLAARHLTYQFLYIMFVMRHSRTFSRA